jgi:ABC-type cobalamin transport system permease subunit
MERYFGGNPIAVILRLLLISVIVGIILSALGITPENFLYRMQILIRRIYDMGFGVIEWALGYLVIGAIFVIPIWLIARVFGLLRDRDTDKDITDKRT